MKRTSVGFLFALLVLLPTRAPALGQEEAPPTPEERIATLRAERAEARAELGKWAATKRLGLEGRAYLHAAIRLDPDCRSARVKLGHRKDPNGGWKEDREREIRDDPKVREKVKPDFVEREKALLAEEAAACTELGLALMDENRPELAAPLLRHAVMLEPSNEAALGGLGLVKIGWAFGTEELRKEVMSFAQAREVGARFLGGLTGASTKVRACGAVTAEVPGDAAAAAELARLGQRALLLTLRRFSKQVLPQDWVWLVVAQGSGQFSEFLGQVNLPEDRRALFRSIGSARIFSPRHCVACLFRPGTDPAATGAPCLLHMMAEHVVWTVAGNDVPMWLVEAAGVEAYYAVSGKPGTACVVFEESQGLVSKDQFQDTATWPSLLFRRAALADLPRLEVMRTAQIQALAAEDVFAAHAYYRFLLLTRPEGLGAYAAALTAGTDDVEAFEAAFGATHAEISDELVELLMGR